MGGKDAGFWDAPCTFTGIIDRTLPPLRCSGPVTPGYSVHTFANCETLFSRQSRPFYLIRQTAAELPILIVVNIVFAIEKPRRGTGVEAVDLHLALNCVFEFERHSGQIPVSRYRVICKLLSTVPIVKKCDRSSPAFTIVESRKMRLRSYRRCLLRRARRYRCPVGREELFSISRPSITSQI